MPGGWENAPDYGGRNPGPLGWLFVVLVGALLTGAVFACTVGVSP